MVIQDHGRQGWRRRKEPSTDIPLASSLEWEEASHEKLQGECVPAKGNSSYKGPVAGPGLTQYRFRNKAGVVWSWARDEQGKRWKERGSQGSGSPRFQGCCKDYVSSPMGSICRFEDRGTGCDLPSEKHTLTAPWRRIVGARAKQRGAREWLSH